MHHQPYTFVILRYRHDPLAGELVNLGVLLHAPESRTLLTAFRRTYGRMSKLYPDLDGAALTADLRRFETAFRRLSDEQGKTLFTSDVDADVLAKRVINDPAGAFVWGEMGAGITKV